MQYTDPLQVICCCLIIPFLLYFSGRAQTLSHIWKLSLILIMTFTKSTKSWDLSENCPIGGSIVQSCWIFHVILTSL
ncbi:hypothetical protein BY996DRAFT_6964782, partial [Phakopsora pachyrhizi]